MNSIYWDVYPGDRVIRPFSTLYAEDKSKDKSKSSSIMWGLRMLTVPTKDNPLWRMTRIERIEELSTIYKPEELEKILSLEAPYVNAMASYIMRRYMFYQNLLEQREEYMATLTYAENANQLDDMLVKTKKIWDEFMKIKKELEVEEEAGHVQGGREESASEKGLI